MVWLAAFGSPLANRLGAARFVLFWVVTSIAAVGAALCAAHPNDQAPLVGASGAISGMMGAAARFGFRIDRTSGRPAFGGPVLPICDGAAVARRRDLPRRLDGRSTSSPGWSGSMPGRNSQIAWEAHIGGFLVGFFGIALFDRPSQARPPERRCRGVRAVDSPLEMTAAPAHHVRQRRAWRRE